MCHSIFGQSLIALFAVVTMTASTDAQEPASRLTVHAHLTQAYGFSRGGLVTGLGRDGTADYRRAAIIARYDATPANRFVIQLAHRRLGDSPTMQFEDDIKLDMAFFEHRFRDGTTARVGKTVMPWGIYNEIRYVGTLQPFYRAPLSVYWEGTYSSETIDGVLVSHRFRSGKPWELAADAFGGSYNFLEFNTVQLSPTSAPVYIGARLQAKNVLGSQLWLSTPIEGLRLGASARRHTDVGGIFPRGNGWQSREFTASVDGTFERWMLRSEANHIRSGDVEVASRYVQAGVRPIPKLSVNVQSEFTNFYIYSISPAPTVKMTRDNAVGINLFLDAMTVLKIEAHTTRGFNVEEAINLLGTPRSGSYFISSFSVSF
jgi:hypothetical protein